METVIVISVLGMFAAGGLYHAYELWRRADSTKIRRALLRARRVPIAEAMDGAVARLDGRVVEDELLTAPLTGRRCVYYLAIIEEDDPDRRSGAGGWTERARESRAVPFAIDDGTGRALVDPADAEIDAALDSSSRSGVFDSPTATEAAFLDRLGIQGTGRIFNKTLRYREAVLAPGEQVAVRGLLVRERVAGAGAPEVGFREAPPTRLRVAGSTSAPILISDAREVTRQPPQARR